MKIIDKLYLQYMDNVIPEFMPHKKGLLLNVRLTTAPQRLTP